MECSPRRHRQGKVVNEAERLKALKDKSGLTWPQLAEKFGVDVMTLIRWQSGARVMKGSAVKLMDRLEEETAPEDNG